MKIVCVSASNILHSGEQSTSLKICGKIIGLLESRAVSFKTVDLRKFALSPCTGCGSCYKSRRCRWDKDFNRIYEMLAQADAVFFVSPHYAPIPAKLCMFLEKAEEISFLHWWREPAYQSELFGLPAGIISHGGGGDWALSSYRAMVNDTIANALDTIQCRVIPWGRWKTGLSLPVSRVGEGEGAFPQQEYDWDALEAELEGYARLVLAQAGERAPAVR